MTTERKLKIARAVSKVLHWNYDLPIEVIESRIKINPFHPNKGVFSVPFEKHLNLVNKKDLYALKEELNAVDVFSQGMFKKLFFHVEINMKDFISDALAINSPPSLQLAERQKVIVDFSSPNVAKPFHMGHLRSTVIGNFISNVNQYLGNDVVRINYVGDWGVQFGLLKVGLQKNQYTEGDVAKNPVKTLLEAYVKANMMANENAEVIELAKKIFHDLEFADDDSHDLKEWRTIREYTIKEWARIYSRIGVHFDEYGWESDYSARRIKPLIEEMKRKQIVDEENDGALVSTIFGQTIPVMKHDGTSLYLARDVAAALDRYERHKFDKAYYVVDTMQRGHFISLVELLKPLNGDVAESVCHVPFGRVVGLSTRKGKAVWLDDILDDLYKKMEQKQKETSTTRVPVGGEITDTLAQSCLIIYDLKQKRSVHYSFDLDTISQIEGFTGAKLQYCHCRLYSLEQNCGVSLPSECHPELLMEPEALRIINTISRFNENLMDSYRLNEACILVNYLFDLCDVVNRAFPKLKVKGQPTDIASQRLLLFSRARQILKAGMKIVGMKPLNEM